MHPKVPAKTMQKFIEYAKASPGKINYGSSGIGTMHHLSMEAIKAALKLEMTHVPFRGTGQSVPALLGGHVDALFSAYPLGGAVQAKEVSLLASNAAKRSPQLPDVPTIAEFIPGFDFASRIGLFARRGTADAILKRISGEIIEIAKAPDTMNRFAVVGVDAAGSGPADFQRVLDAEIQRVANTVRAAGIQPQ